MSVPVSLCDTIYQDLKDKYSNQYPLLQTEPTKMRRAIQEWRRALEKGAPHERNKIQSQMTASLERVNLAMRNTLSLIEYFNTKIANFTALKSGSQSQTPRPLPAFHRLSYEQDLDDGPDEKGIAQLSLHFIELKTMMRRLENLYSDLAKEKDAAQRWA